MYSKNAGKIVNIIQFPNTSILQIEWFSNTSSFKKLIFNCERRVAGAGGESANMCWHIAYKSRREVRRCLFAQETKAREKSGGADFLHESLWQLPESSITRLLSADDETIKCCFYQLIQKK